MRNVVVLLPLVLAFACTKHNPEACCSTPDQCSSYGLSGITPCEGTQVCNATGACVAPMCTTNADCTDPSTPLCVNQLCVAPQCTTNADCTDSSMPFCENDVCVAACGSDGDCTSMAGKPYCATGGACVGCLDDTQCTAQAPVCDGSANACRGCVMDSECPSGICLESNGACADVSEAVFVDIGGSDSGTCTKASPCATIQYALGKMSGARNVLKVVPTNWNTASTIVLGAINGYIDGSMTSMTGTGSDGLFSMQNSGNVTFTGFLFTGTMSTPIADVRTGQLTFFGDDLAGNLAVNGGTLLVQRATGGFVTCGDIQAGGVPGGVLTVSESSIQGVNSNHCAVAIEENTFDETVTEAQPITIGSASTPFTIENNVIVAKDAFLDAIERLEGPPGSVFRFNTLVNLSGEDETAEPLDCQNSSVEASNNIIAWHTSQAINCPVTYTLVDSVEALPPGAGNQVGDVSTFFVNMAGKDFHLGSASPALHAAQPGVNVSIDHDGNPRPEPANTNDDVGAFESPH